MGDRSLPRIAPEREKLGLPTIMDRSLATRHGPRYVHLAAFAIDVDRVRDAFDADLPFGWEVFLTEVYLLARFDAEDAPLLADTVLSILDGERDALGGQLAFAVWDAMERGVLARGALRSAFSSWRARPRELVRALAPLFVDPEPLARNLARHCLDAALDPPLAPPTREALEAIART